MALNNKRRRTGLSTDELHAETAATLKLCGIRELWEKGELTDLGLRAECDGTSDESPMKVHGVIYHGRLQQDSQGHAFQWHA